MTNDERQDGNDSYFVHESAYVDEPCEIGAGTKIWHFCHVMKDATIGRGCNLGQNVFVANDARPNQLWINGGDGTFTDRAAAWACAVDQDGQAKAGDTAA